MGNLCDCCYGDSKNSGPTQKTPLLNPPSTDVVSSAPARSARLHNPNREEDFTTSLEVLSLVSLGTVTTLPALDKTFQDHAKLYNDLYSTFREFKVSLHEFKAKFDYDTGGIPVLADCLVLLNKRCGNAELHGTRSKNCITITYDKRSVSENCSGEPVDVLETLELYNSCNKQIKDVLNKAPKVKSSISLILDEEQKLKRDVTKVDPDGRQGPEPLRTTSSNFSKLHKLLPFVDTIQKYSEKTFKEIADGSTVLFREEV